DDQIAARDVDHDCAALEPADPFGVEKTAGLIRRRREQDQRVDFAEQVLRIGVKAGAPLKLWGEPAAVAVVDGHLEAARTRREHAADPAHAENAEMLAEDFDAVELSRGPSGPGPAADQVDALGRAPRSAEQQKHADLGDRFA